MSKHNRGNVETGNTDIRWHGSGVDFVIRAFGVR